MSEPPISPGPPMRPLPSARRGILQMLAAAVGALMLLPGICAFLLAVTFPDGFKNDPTAKTALLIALALGFAGLVLLSWVFGRRSPRAEEPHE